MSEKTILGIYLPDRIKGAGLTQKILSKYAGVIINRLGTHELTQDVCSRQGLILLVLQGEEKKQYELEKELLEIGGIKIEKMIFKY